MQVVKIIMTISVMLCITACNDASNDSTNIAMVQEMNESYSIPSFGKEKAVGCEAEKDDENKSCSEVNTILSSSEKILEKLREKSNIESTSLSKKEEVSLLPNSPQEQLTMLVEESQIEEKPSNAKDDLEELVSSVEPSKLHNDSIGRFDKEQFKNTWEELDALVASSEGSNLKQEDLKKELEELVISASSNNHKNIDEVKKNVKNLIATSTKNRSSKNRQFIENIVSDISDKKIELLESNKAWIKIKIKSGDSLSTLAKSYYGDEKKYRVIYNMNRDKIQDDYIIYVGDILKIPTLNSIQGI